MSILLIGSEGAQGKRYQAILNYLGRRTILIDEKRENVKFSKSEVDGIIIATPTDSHIGIIEKYLDFNRPILCEKPITKNIDALRELAVCSLRLKMELNMVCQYRQITSGLTTGSSHYDYFRHGNDGLYWDCLQIIGLAKEKVELRENSPVWDCTINAEKLNIALMDWAYVTEIKQWLMRERQMAFSQVIEMHEKTHLFASTH